MAEPYEKLSTRKNTKEKVMEDCKKEYFRLHPERKYDFISEDAMVNILADYYLNT